MIRWITGKLGTAPFNEIENNGQYAVIDVRDLVDKGGNSAKLIREKVAEGAASLAAGKETVICCDLGMSRSNAVAAGILHVSAPDNYPTFSSAIKAVREATGESQIKADVLASIRRALADRISSATRDDGAVLVTGGSGYIGRHLVPTLAQTRRVFAPRRKEIDLIEGSTQLDIAVDEHNVDCIVHLAAPKIHSSNRALGQSLTMLRNVVDVCLAHGIHLVFPSSAEVYNSYTGTVRPTESTPLRTTGPAGETKYLCEELICSCRREQGLHATVLRAGRLYGKASNRPNFLRTFLHKIRMDEPITTHRYANGRPAVDLLHIDDFSTAAAKAVELKPDGEFNIGSGETIPIRELVELLRDTLGSSSTLDEVLIEADTARIKMNIDKAKRELGWEPTMPIRRGLQAIADEFGR